MPATTLPDVALRTRHEQLREQLRAGGPLHAEWVPRLALVQTVAELLRQAA